MVKNLTQYEMQAAAKEKLLFFVCLFVCFCNIDLDLTDEGVLKTIGYTSVKCSGLMHNRVCL